jgi:hypothetical protein
LAAPCYALEEIQLFEGEAANDQFGISVTSLDMDGDGWADVAVGANTNDAGGSAAGRAYLFLGGEGDSSADLVLTGPSAGGHFGWCVREVGDLDKDGFQDLAVGAHFNSEVNTRSGKVYVFLGSAAPDSVCDLILAESIYDARFGYAVSGGDINGDGYSDLAVGAPNAYDKGLVKVFFGGDPPDTVCDLVMRGEGTYDLFGSALCLEGDLNGDDYADLAVGAHGYNGDAGFNTGRVYVFFGGSEPDTVPDFVLDGSHQNDYFGFSVASGGDLDMDDLDDLCIGSYGSDGGDSTEVGKCFVFLGGDTLSQSPDIELWSGASHNEEFGGSVALISTDGVFPSYLAVGAEGNDDAGIDAGKVYSFEGPSPEGGVPSGEAAGLGAGASMGHSVCLLRDFVASHDGVQVLTGAYEEGTSGAARFLGLQTAGFTPSVEGQPTPGRRDYILRVGGLIEFESPPGAVDCGLSVFDVRGRLVYKIRSGGSDTTIWRGQSSDGAYVTPGTYIYILSRSTRHGKIVVVE